MSAHSCSVIPIPLFWVIAMISYGISWDSSAFSLKREEFDWLYTRDLFDCRSSSLKKDMTADCDKHVLGLCIFRCSSTIVASLCLRSTICFSPIGAVPLTASLTISTSLASRKCSFAILMLNLALNLFTSNLAICSRLLCGFC